MVVIVSLFNDMRPVPMAHGGASLERLACAGGSRLFALTVVVLPLVRDGLVQPRLFPDAAAELPTRLVLVGNELLGAQLLLRRLAS